ncbi:MAG: hypothetical protein BMS9Abin33_0571 [Gammaproteobacteria bacterium]|nr:MAG: hypothetical protein BMS9Abin33_0571 [Gammaproteobacteria bacterium]
MQNLDALVKAVQTNCHISDARYAGNYSMCTFLLKMREYYRWENRFPYSRKLEKDVVGEWLVAREQYWQEIEADDYLEIPLANSQLDPFDADAINREILPGGYVYSSGYGIFGKPHFFVGKLINDERREDIRILVSSNEYARDLVAPPAMAQGNTIYIRKESITRFLWERIEEWRWNRNEDSPMARAIACYGDEKDIDTLLDPMTENEIEIMILHEFGEVYAGKLLGPQWEKMLLTLSGTRAEFMVRALRDNLADCLYTLPELIESSNDASLHLYFANFSGLRKFMFPEARNLYQQWITDGTIVPLQQLVASAKEDILEKARRTLTLFGSGHDNPATKIENFLNPEAT